MANLNLCQFIGRLGGDPETRTLKQTTIKVSSFSLAITEYYKDKTTDERKSNTEWISCVAWRHVAEFVEKYLHKGDMVYVKGKIKTRSYEKDGETKYATEILLDDVQPLTKKERQSIQEVSGKELRTADANDDLPF